MMAEYDAYAARVGVLEVPDGYDQTAQLTTNRVHDLVRANWPGLTAIMLLLLGGAFWGCHRASRARLAGLARVSVTAPARPWP